MSDNRHSYQQNRHAITHKATDFGSKGGFTLMGWGHFFMELLFLTKIHQAFFSTDSEKLDSGRETIFGKSDNSRPGNKQKVMLIRMSDHEGFYDTTSKLAASHILGDYS